MLDILKCHSGLVKVAYMERQLFGTFWSLMPFNLKY